MCCVKHLGFVRFFPQITSSLLRVCPASHADLGHSFPDYPVLQCFMWVPSLDRGDSRRGGANIVFVLHNAEHQHMTDTQFMATNYQQSLLSISTHNT